MSARQELSVRQGGLGSLLHHLPPKLFLRCVEKLELFLLSSSVLPCT